MITNQPETGVLTVMFLNLNEISHISIKAAANIDEFRVRVKNDTCLR